MGQIQAALIEDSEDPVRRVEFLGGHHYEQGADVDELHQPLAVLGRQIRQPLLEQPCIGDKTLPIIAQRMQLHRLQFARAIGVLNMFLEKRMVEFTQLEVGLVARLKNGVALLEDFRLRACANSADTRSRRTLSRTVKVVQPLLHIDDFGPGLRFAFDQHDTAEEIGIRFLNGRTWLGCGQ